MDPDTETDFHPQKLIALRQVIENEGPAGISAVIACDTRRNSDRLKLLLEIVGIDNTTEFHGEDCDIYERAAAQSSLDRQ
jgi:hypothetical protein